MDSPGNRDQTAGSGVGARSPRGEPIDAASSATKPGRLELDASTCALLDWMPDGIVVVDSASCISFVNSQTEKLLGYSRDELLGESINVLVPEAQRAAHSEHTRAYLDAPSVRQMGAHMNFSARDKFGTLIPVEISLSPININGATGVVAAVRDVRFQRDVTHRLQMEATQRAALAEIGRVAGSSPDIGEVFEELSEIVRTLLPLDRMAIALVDADGSTVTNPYVIGTPRGEYVARHSCAIAGTLTERAIRTRRPVVVNDECDPRPGDHPGRIADRKAGLRSVLAIPLVAQGKAIGSLNFRSRESNVYSQREAELGQRIASQIAGAIANSRLYERLREQAETLQDSNRELMAVNRLLEQSIEQWQEARNKADAQSQRNITFAAIGRIISSSLEIDEVYEQFAEQVATLIPFDRIVVATVDAERDTATNQYVAGLAIPGLEKGTTGPISGTLRDAIVRKRASLRFDRDESTRHAATDARHKAALTVGLLSMLAVPLVFKAQIVGILTFRSRDPKAYSASHLALAEQVGAQIAGAIANARLHADTRREARERTALAEISRVVSSSLELDEVYEQFADQVATLIPFERIVLSTVDLARDRLRVAYVAGTELPEWEPGVTHRISETMTGEVARTQAGIRLGRAELSQLSAQSSWHAAALASGLPSLMIVPLVYKGETIGTLSFRSRDPNAYSEQDLALAEQVGAQIAGAIANARLHAETQREARERAALVEIGRVISSSLEIDDVYEQLAEQVATLIPFDRLTVVTVNPDGVTSTDLHVAGLAIPGYEPGTSHSLEGSLTGEVVSKAAPITVGDVAEYGPEGHPGKLADLEAGLHSAMGIPFTDRGEVIGSLNFRSKARNAYSEHEMALGEQVAAQIAGALANARLHAALQRLADERQLLGEISRAATTGLEVDELGKRFLNMVRERVPFDRGTVRLVDAATGNMGTGVAVGLGWDLPLPTERSQAATEAIGLGRVVATSLREARPDGPPGLLARLGVRSSVRLPALTDEAVVGLVALHRLSPSGFRDDELEFLQNAAAQIAPALDNARLLDEIGRLATIVETNPDLICRIDLRGNLKYLNPAGRSMLGLPPDADAEGLNLRDFLDKPSFELLLSSGFPMALRTGSWSGELRACRPDGDVFAVGSVVAANYHRNGRLLGLSVSMRDIEARKRAEEELRRLATTDTLTGLLNRRQFSLMLDQSVRLAERSNAPGALIYLDLDNLKYVNDAYGHTVGDMLLRAVAGRLRESVRASDVVARMGGDEFAVILNGADTDAAMEKASQLVEQVSQVTVTVGEERIHTAASAGVAVFPIPDATGEDLVAFADVAMYGAKDAGRNQAHLYNPSERGREAVSALQRTSAMIMDALDNDRLVPYRQPIILVRDRSVAMYEVLVRLKDSEGRIHAPGEFIPQAEALDLVQLIDERVLDLALQRWRAFADAGTELRLTVNVSARSVSGEFAHQIAERADRHGVPHNALVLEITETAAMRAGGQIMDFMEVAAESGFGVAIDDFGSGATSFRQIRTLRCNLLKLDGSLIEHMKDEPMDREFTRAVTALAHAMGVAVVAEFVQDEETLEFLGEVGVEYAQGYYLGKPEPFPDAPSAPA